MMGEIAPPREPIWVDEPQTLEALLESLRRCDRMALDTESNSLYAYRERVCLIQISIPQGDYLIDPLALEDLAPLGKILADPHVEKVFHDAKYDIAGLKRDFGFSLNRIFDTMVASRMLGWPHHGLASILRERFGVVLDKRWQRSDWGRRPLPAEQQRYACLDSHYLLALRDMQLRELLARGLQEEAEEAFRRQSTACWTKESFDPQGFWGIKEAQQLDDRGLAILRELYLFREKQAEAQDIPPFKVLSTSALVTLSWKRPGNWEALAELRILSSRELQLYGKGVLAAIARGKVAPIPKRPSGGHGLDGETLTRFQALKAWMKARARVKGVEPDLLLPNQNLWQLAQRNPTDMAELRESGILSPWAMERYGEGIVSALKRATSLARRKGR